MSKKLPAEEAFRQMMNELPLPDEDESWQKMKQLLDEKEKRRAFVFLRNYKILNGAILLLFLCLWLVISPEKMNRQTSVAIAKYKTSEKQNSRQNKTKERLTDDSFAKNKTSTQQVISTGISLSVQRQNNKGIDLSQRTILFNKNKQSNNGLRKAIWFKKGQTLYSQIR